MDREALAPAGLTVSSAEVNPDPKRLGGVHAAIEQPDHRLGHHQRDVALQAIAKPDPLLSQRVAVWREVHPDVIPADLDRINTNVVSPLVECAAARQIEPGMVPVARQYPVLHSAAMQRKPHVRTPVVDRGNRAVGEIERQAMPVEQHRQATGGSNLP